MNLQRFSIAILCLLLCGRALAQAPDIDKELVNLAEKLAAPIKDSGKKKVAVLDFTDLQGGSTELGKYIAEQLTVNLVLEKRTFSVLDRANLNKILSEHKLTAKGLVDPENAKKIGQFAGVDVLILGTIIPKTQSISVTAKIITTDSAEIVGAARAEFKTDENVQQLLSHAAKSDEIPGPSQPLSPSPTVKKPFGDLQVKVESLKLLPSSSPGYGFTTLTLIITNTSDTRVVGVGIGESPYKSFNLSNGRDEQFETTDVTGIETVFQRNDGVFAGTPTDIPPKGSIIIVAKAQVRWNGRPGDYRPYHLQSVLVFGEESKGRYPDLKKYNLSMEIK